MELRLGADALSHQPHSADESQSQASPDSRWWGRFHSLMGEAECLVAKGKDTERGRELGLVLYSIHYKGQSIFVLEWLER